MQTDLWRYLEFSSLTKLGFWDYYTQFKKATWLSTYPSVELKQVLTQRKQNITIDDTQVYKRCQVQWYGNGVVLRDEVSGAKIKTKKQQLCRTNDFLVAEIDAKSGGYGIVPEYLEGAIVSGHYFLFEIDQAKLSPDFLGLIIKLQQFASQVQATGSTNYAAIRPSHVLGYTIPLPPLNVQQELVNAYDVDLEEARRKEQGASISKKESTSFLLDILELEEPSPVIKKKGFQFIEYQNIERWDYLQANDSINIGLKNAKYSIKSLGSIYRFITRSWVNRNNSKTFRYVEIGSIDPLSGITEAKELMVAEAPSRATQLVSTGDLLIATTRPYLKKFALVTSDFDGCICSSGFSVIEPSSDYNLAFLLEFLMSVYGVEQLKSKMTGALYPAITESELKTIKIPFPPIEIQNQIIKTLNDMKIRAKKLDSEASVLKQQALIAFEQSIFSSPA